MITGALEDGGLGFDLKWNMGFMNDFIGYMRNDPYFRSHHHEELTFSMIYAYSEKFICVFSHDEVVHGKSSMVGKMPGTREQKLANLRLAYAYYMTHPGKKLIFMGQDMAEFDEWNEHRQVQWELLQYPEHAGISNLCKELNALYVNEKALHELDDRPEGFEWINAISASDCYLSYLRKGAEEGDILLMVANFSGAEQKIRTGVPYEGKYLEIFNTNEERFGGNAKAKKLEICAEDVRWDNKEQSIVMEVPPLSLSILRFMPYTEEELEKVIAERIRKRTIIVQKDTKKVKATKGKKA